MGLGLYMAQALVDFHTGRIWVESEPGAGSTFSVLLPITQEEPIGEGVAQKGKK